MTRTTNFTDSKTTFQVEKRLSSHPGSRTLALLHEADQIAWRSIFNAFASCTRTGMDIYGFPVVISIVVVTHDFGSPIGQG